jgi:hypothetical protein
VYDGFDAFLLSRVRVGLDSGFDAFPRIDPLILGDVNGDGALTGQDASILAQKAADPASHPEIPAIPPAPAPVVLVAAAEPTNTRTRPAPRVEVAAVPAVVTPVQPSVFSQTRVTVRKIADLL